ncbi:MAG: radical SAM family heme chaperone HemW [Bacilli bacterium]
MRSVYIHIPFCSSICSYCDFCKVLYNPKYINSYLLKLKEEILSTYEEDEVKSIYIGGGTPSSLSNSELTQLLNIIKIFNASSSCEITIEANPQDIDEDFIKTIMAFKVNRLSIGVQSLNKYKLKYLNRKHDKKEVKRAIKLLNYYDFDNYNIDLIYAVPIENMRILRSDIKGIVRLNPKHISTYSLIIEESTALYINNEKAINEDIDYKMYKYICSYLKKKDYIHYEVSNFSKHGYSSIHNTNYWNNDEYYGFGLSATGYINDIRYENTKNLTSYLNNIYRKEELLISKKECMENELILGLRKLDGVNLKDFFNKFNINLQDVFNIKDEIKHKNLILNDTNIKINEKKIYIMNEILCNLLEKEKTTK